MTRKLRKPTGLPPWPIILIAGAEKVGKSYSCAAASASPHIGRTFWIGCGEDDPDEYGAIDGARFEIVEHDGTYKDILDAITEVSAEPYEDGRPNMIVFDSASALWELLSGEAQSTANRRAKQKANRGNKPDADDVPISMDLWNTATGRWNKIITAFKEHLGPVLITSRLEQVTVMDGGKPTTQKELKIKAQKNLSYDVGAVVMIPAREQYLLTGVRSLAYHPEDPSKPTDYPGFTVEKLWSDMGLIGKGKTAPRQFQGADGEHSSAAENQMTQEQYNELIALIKRSGMSQERTWAAFSAWAGREIGTFHQITEGEAAVFLIRLADPWAAPEPTDGADHRPSTEEVDQALRDDRDNYREVAAG